MKPKKQPQPSREDIERQKQIEKRVKDEGVELDHPKGKERFDQVIKRGQKERKLDYSKSFRA
jgi:hypothetical protein